MVGDVELGFVVNMVHASSNDLESMCKFQNVGQLKTLKEHAIEI